MYHEWKVYDQYKARKLDIGVFDKSNLPLLSHRKELYVLHRTNVSMDDFISFVEVDMHDRIRDGEVGPDHEDNNLRKIDENTVLTRVQFRYYIQKYFPERIKWTKIGPVYNDTRERDTHRYYWSSKMAKDFIMLT